jgi:hypothetical protein
MPTLKEAEYHAEALSVRRGATTRTWLWRAMPTPERPTAAKAWRKETTATPEVPRAKSATSAVVSTVSR